MKELLTVNIETGTVSARDLHNALEIKERFSAWFERFNDLFVENVDYTSVGLPTEVINNGGTQVRELKDYNLTVDMAKHICMLSKTEKGRKCRQYFIDLEKAWNTPEQIMARALKIASDTQNKLLEKIETQNARIEQMRPKEIFADAVCTSKTSILIGELAKLICQNGYDIGQNRLFQWMRDNGYLMRDGESRNMPQQRYINNGLFDIKETNIQNPDGSVRITKTTKVTGKGQVYFINKFLTEKEV